MVKNGEETTGKKGSVGKSWYRISTILYRNGLI